MVYDLSIRSTLFLHSVSRLYFIWNLYPSFVPSLRIFLILTTRGLGKPEKEEIKGEGGETEAKEEGAEKEVKE